MLKIIGDKSVEQILEENKNYLSHYWFGGNVAEFESDKLPGYTFCLGAYGDVRITLVDKTTGEELEYVKDKSNQAGFYHTMSSHFNDQTLYECLEEKHPRYQLIIDNNNWWECYAVNQKTQRIIDLGDTLNADLLSEAIQEIIDLEDDFIEWTRDDDGDNDNFDMVLFTAPLENGLQASLYEKALSMLSVDSSGYYPLDFCENNTSAYGFITDKAYDSIDYNVSIIEKEVKAILNDVNLESNNQMYIFNQTIKTYIK